MTDPMNRTFLSEFHGRDNGRTAVIYSSWSGYEVGFLHNGAVIERRSLYNHNRSYAEDACENWVTEVIK